MTAQPQDPLKDMAERYVRLVLAVGGHDADYVDAYYGPPEWRKQVEAEKLPLAEIAKRATTLRADLAKAPATPPVNPSTTLRAGSDAELWKLRLQYLDRQLAALQARVSMLQGTRLTFDEESRALYDAVAPRHTEADFEAVIAKLEKALPGEGPLIQRYDTFKSAFIIPRDRLDRVSRPRFAPVATAPSRPSSCRQARASRWSTSPQIVERLHWYQGNYKSLIQVNTDLPIYIDRAIDLACHEGYPGHHVYNVLLEKNLVRDRDWVEFTVYPLFSPQSLIAEGTANYGIEVAFSKEERVAFERDVLFPLARLNASRAKEYYDIMALVEQVSYAGNEAARRYLDGKIDAKGAADWLERYAMMPRARAEQRVKVLRHRTPNALRDQLQPRRISSASSSSGARARQ